MFRSPFLPARHDPMPDIPVLETDRLVLRGFRPDDLDAMTAMWTMPEVVRYIGGVMGAIHTAAQPTQQPAVVAAVQGFKRRGFGGLGWFHAKNS